MRERGLHIFEKLMRGTDRLSIIKFHTKNGINVECKLVFKNSHDVMLRKEITEVFL